VAASQACPQSLTWQTLDLNSWTEDHEALGSSLPASGLLKVRGQEKKWLLDTAPPQGHFSIVSGECLNRVWYFKESPWPEVSAASGRGTAGETSRGRVWLIARSIEPKGSVGLPPSVHVWGRDATFLGRRGKEAKPLPDTRAFGLPLGPIPQARGCLVQAGPAAIRGWASLIHRGWLAGNITMRFLHCTFSLSIKYWVRDGLLTL